MNDDVSVWRDTLLNNKATVDENLAETKQPVAYYKLLNNNQAVVSMIKAGGKTAQKMTTHNRITNTAKLLVDGVEIELSNFIAISKGNKPKANPLTETTSKLLTLIVSETQKCQSLNVGDVTRLELSVEVFADRLGRTFDSSSAGRKARQRFRDGFFIALKRLETTKIHISQGNAKNGNPIVIGSIPMLYYKPIDEKKGLTEVVVIQDFIDYLKAGYMMQYYTDIDKLTGGAYFLHNNFCRYYNNTNNHIQLKDIKQPKQANIFKLTTAIDWTEGAIPTLDEVKSGDRRFTQRILEPLFELLEHEHGMIKRCQLCQAKGEPLTTEQTENMSSYAVLKDAYILVTEVRAQTEFNERIAPYIGKKLLAQDKAQQRKNKVSQRGAKELEKGKYKDK